jgi:hypothetical protein
VANPNARCVLRSDEQGLNSTTLVKLSLDLNRKFFGPRHTPYFVQFTLQRSQRVVNIDIRLDCGTQPTNLEATTMYYRLVPQKPIDGVGAQGWNLLLPSTIGRSHESQVCIDDDSISRSHCQLFLSSDESLQVRDLNSLNGTVVNGERIKKVHSLYPGDVIQVGSISLRVEYASDTDPGKPPVKRATSPSNVTQPMRAVRLEPPLPPPPTKNWWEFWK